MTFVAEAHHQEEADDDGDEAPVAIVRGRPLA